MPQSEEKPQRLYFKSYLKVIENTVGSNMFRTFYAKTPSRGEFDALGDGQNSCAFYVSSVLVIFKKISAIHGLVDSVVEDMEKSGWLTADEPQPGDILVWEQLPLEDGVHGHIGFYVGDNQAISTSVKAKTPIKHDINFGEAKRKIVQIWRLQNWEDSRLSGSGGFR